ncbi:uncharacterized protein VTP21DRAFT_11692 [Calcarisporiella thermophila]|uniref:uncharacterized protein n=1 Tax=Calcarisporiella thermophila TaxID=911321 RepID=UPI003741F999
MSTASGGHDSLARILGDLKSRNEKVRRRAGEELREHVVSVLRESSTEGYVKFTNDINSRVFNLINSPDVQDKIAGVVAIDKLLEFCDDNSSMVTRFANYLRMVVPSNDPQLMQIGAKTIGSLAIINSTLTSEIVEFEIKRAFEYLQVDVSSTILTTGDRNEYRHHGAVLILRELALKAPTQFYAYIPQFLEHIWVALRESKQNIRESAADALSACLHILFQRDTPSKVQLYKKILEEAQKGLRLNTVDAIHGSLLVYKEVLQHAGMFARDMYGEICETALRYKEHRDQLVRRTVTLLIPTLAAYNTQTFVDLYLHRCMSYLLGQLKKERDRSAAFIAIGKVTMEVGSNISQYLEPIVANIREGLAGAGVGGGKSGVRKARDSDTPIFQCVSMLARAVGPALTKFMHEILDLIFACGLNEPLSIALVDLAREIPPLLPTIQDRLLEMLSMVLSGQPYRSSTIPMTPVTPSVPTQLREMQALEQKDLDTINQALYILATFDFRDRGLEEFVRDCVVPYLEDDSIDIRKSAALACCHLLRSDNTAIFERDYANYVVEEVLEKLLAVGISDPDPTIRLSVLTSLDESFDAYLAEPDKVRSLFIALNDEVFPIREQAIGIIGRLSSHNPAFVMPSLRKTLVQLLTEVQCSTTNKNKEEALRLLAKLASNGQRLIQPYLQPIVNVLLPRVSGQSPGVTTGVLTVLCELAKAGGEKLAEHLDLLIPLLIEMLQDQSPTSSMKREKALKMLGQLASSTGFVIEPYTRYPNLLPTLVKILRQEQDRNIRRETIKLIGVLGALDPYRHKVSFVANFDEKSELKAGSAEVGPLMQGTCTTADEFYPTIAVGALSKILRDSSLSTYHSRAVEAITYIFKFLGTKSCLPFIPSVLPPLLGIMRTCQSAMLEFYFKQLSSLVVTMRQHVQAYARDIFTVVEELWRSAGTNIQIMMLGLVETISLALEGEFKVYLSKLLPYLLQVCDTDQTERRQLTHRVLHTLVVLGTSLEEYMHLVLPVVVRLFERNETPLSLRKAAIVTVGQLCRKMIVTDYASRIIHPLARIIATSPTELKMSAMDTLCALVFQLGSDYAIFIPMVNKILVQQRVQHSTYDILVSKLLKGEPLPQGLGSASEERLNELEDASGGDMGGVKGLLVNQQHLRKAWETSQRFTKEDWHEWMRRLSAELLKESPSQALRACSRLAGAYSPLAKELFNAAFSACWSELYVEYQSELVQAIETALLAPNIPNEIVQQLLNLAEFMEHDEKSLGIKNNTLAEYALRCHAYAKALHYKELEFLTDPTKQSTIEDLMNINQKLQQLDAAMGLLAYGKKLHDINLKETWYEKLEHWDVALEAYEQKQRQSPQNFDATLGRMRCLHALGEWETLAQLSRDLWCNGDDKRRREIAPFAAAAAWGNGQWDLMNEYITAIKPGSTDYLFFCAILALHRDQFEQAVEFVNRTRDSIDSNLTTLLAESYNRAYLVVVRTQLLSELEEIISYKQFVDQPDRQASIRRTWMKRLRGCQRSVDVWQRILKVRMLVAQPHSDVETWIKFANLCRKVGRFSIAEKTLVRLCGGESAILEDAYSTNVPPQVVYARLKYMWAIGAREKALNILQDYTTLLSQTLKVAPANGSVYKALLEPHSISNMPSPEECTRLLARCYLKQGEWQIVLHDELDDEIIPKVLHSLSLATQHDPNWYKAWHTWALANFEVIKYYEKSGTSFLPNMLAQHIVPAVRGFFRSIALSKGSSLQDTLRLLTLWFSYGYQQDVYNAIAEGFNTVSVDTWLQVIPQLIARIHAPEANVRRLILQLLSEVGQAHPQALLYSLMVASKSLNQMRRSAALAIMDKMRGHCPLLVEQALLVSQELIRVAILWHELWHEGLEEASRQYFGNHSVEGMFSTLDPLHKMLERGPETLSEIAFSQSCGRDLQEAQDWCSRYKRTHDVNDLNQAWDLYYQVFKRTGKLLQQLNSLELQYVSPQLEQARNLELAVPGTYRGGEPAVKIASFHHVLNVITSKQRPRKLTVMGTDGQQYQYLLKGHEDLRLDERVMQLFGLVNALLTNDPETHRRHLQIVRYAAIPLSPNSGLLGWVPNTDTLHALIREYRESRSILLNCEHRLMLQMAPDYDNLTLLQKVEVFEHAMENTTGQDLYHILWLRSRSSEAWLERRTNYTRSLAVMSMVGYILGLGDRHPSNLMLERTTGRVVHIDFGDCFEVAMNREKLPERVPFRLTRMLVNAMEVSGIEGSYRITSEHVMRVLRENKESLMAVLEAFVYDPLLNFRLFMPNAEKQKGRAENEPNSQKERANDDEEEAQQNVRDSRKLQGLESEAINMELDEGKNQRAVAVIHRVSNKLTGRDFNPAVALDVSAQVEKLIQQASSIDNLCQSYVGWCAFW